ncbi:adenylate/guanylate cyclase domain-containing protein [Lyngbya sp. CCY1209]|uniref:adenylate/guanylate cyclase domain-containing protein n=1 Tax=Lyngbya sp. CCY1209 TaxID=2886103 RepID=UPI002D20DD4A|nr:adenylate/guanylate cyclase domain-containing protein [Lyngbya sp. CCY1209]MEB3882043.1 FHA domain-containing protein [Lyngbya sp. CCY1209]
MSELRLRLFLENQPDRLISVDRDEFIIGRSPECDLQLPFIEVSRHHTRIYKTADGQWWIEDLGSKNGTSLNDHPVTGTEPLQVGDGVKVDQIRLDVLPPDTQTHSGREIGTVVEGAHLIGRVQDLKQQWIQSNTQFDEDIGNYRRAVARLQDLVEIAKCLNSAESIDAIFSQIQSVIFHDIPIIERLALLIDLQGTGHLELVKAAAKSPAEQRAMPKDGSWIGRSICQRVFMDKVAIKTADAQQDKRFESEPSILVKDIRSCIAVPLWDEDQVVGVLYADAHFSFDYWTRGGDEDLSFFSALGNLVAASVQRWLLTQKLRREETIRQRLERYHTPAVVQQLIRVGALENGRLPSTEAEISILFADIVGFTALSERLPPARLAALLNGFFEEMLHEVFALGGTLDKFIGDCIMAFFGAPEPQPDHADRAVAAAQGMLDRLEQLNATGGLPEPLQLRIAINSGRAVVGDVGSSQRVDYTVLGGTINLAARIEPICPPGQCAVGPATYALLRSPEQFEMLGDYTFKGIDRPVRIYQLRRQ